MGKRHLQYHHKEEFKTNIQNLEDLFSDLPKDLYGNMSPENFPSAYQEIKKT